MKYFDSILLGKIRVLFYNFENNISPVRLDVHVRHTSPVRMTYMYVIIFNDEFWIYIPDNIVRTHFCKLLG